MASSALKVACVGEAMVEMSSISLPGQCRLGVAGDTLNAAVYLRRALPPMHDVFYVSAVGNDALSDRMIDFIAAEGIKTERIVRSTTHGSGLYAITTDGEGERSFQYWRSASAARQLFQHPGGLNFDALDGMDVVFASGISMAILPAVVRQGFLDWIEGFRGRGGRFAFDSNYRPALWEDRATACRFVERAWRLCDIALPSLDDEMALFGDRDRDAVLARFQSYGDCVGALKCAKAGPHPIGGTGEAAMTFPEAQIIVDTTAAGDSFTGAFLAAFLGGGSIGDAMQAGHCLAIEVIAYPGAIIPREAHATFAGKDVA